MLITPMISAPPQRHKIRSKQLKNEQKKLKNKKNSNLFSLTLTHQEIFTRNSRRNMDRYWILHARDKSKESLLLATWWKLELPKVMKNAMYSFKSSILLDFWRLGIQVITKLQREETYHSYFLHEIPIPICVFARVSDEHLLVGES